MNTLINIVVCVKQVSDPEGPESLYSIDHDTKQVVTKGLPPTISTFDENALEAGLRLRDQCSGKLTVISAGYKLSKSLLRKTLAAGADELILLDSESFAQERLDSYGTAWILARAVEKIENTDLILTGRQAADTNAGLVGLYLAEILGISAVSFARDIVVNENGVTMKQDFSDGYGSVEAGFPVLLTVGAEAGQLRNIGLMELRKAKKKPLVEWTENDLPNQDIPEQALVPMRLYKPERERECDFIRADSLKDAGTALAQKLRNAGLV